MRSQGDDEMGSVDVVLKDEFDVAGVAGDRRGAEGTGRLEAETAVRDGDGHPIPAANQHHSLCHF